MYHNFREKQEENKRKTKASKIPSPGGKVARVSGSEEECGREAEFLYNIIDLLLGW